MGRGSQASAGDLLTICADACGDLSAWTLGLPCARGVAVLESEDGSAVLVVSSADVRRIVRSRLDEEGGARRGDLRGIVRRVRAARCGSAFESDLVFLDVARERAGGLHRAVTERWVGWFGHIDPEHSAPRWVVCGTREIDSGRAARGVLIGPYESRQAAGKATGTLDYLFDLCRYPKELERAPGGAACAYKGMGLCPAACDGSEPIGAYQVRAAGSAGAVGAGLGAWRTRIEREMGQAAAGMEFERAEALKRKLEKSGDLESRGMRQAGRVGEIAWVCVAPGVEEGWARVMVVGGRGWRVVCDARDDCDAAALARAVESCAGEVRGDPRGAGGRADVLGLMSWWAYRAADSCGFELATLESGREGKVDPEWLRGAVERWASGGRRADGGDEDGSGDDRVIECDATGRV